MTTFHMISTEFKGNRQVLGPFTAERAEAHTEAWIRAVWHLQLDTPYPGHVAAYCILHELNMAYINVSKHNMLSQPGNLEIKSDFELRSAPAKAWEKIDVALHDRYLDLYGAEETAGQSHDLMTAIEAMERV